jgi:hypothetical protein
MEKLTLPKEKLFGELFRKSIFRILKKIYAIKVEVFL